ncbi:hypothetical protein BC834DRAFT_973962 [Gloeopeniophorella convolvens]|nr:hypothetical protein BC834DRAFT_973962 [Gloeopeniophorella convolvens]
MHPWAPVIVALLSLSHSASSLPIRREVPQEHSHESILTAVGTSLNLNNPSKIVDAVFGLLGNAAASQGLGLLKDPDCLQQATADQAFTNAKAAGDVDGQVNALIYRALERNSGSVGATTNECTSLTAVNPEIAAIQQHQDPASPNAAAVNKAIVLTLAQQIHSVGGDPQDAIKSGTFAPGQIGDPTAKGNSCDDANDAQGCIFSQNLLVPDATADEITAAIQSNGGNATSSSTDGGSATATTPSAVASETSASQEASAASQTQASSATSSAAAAPSSAAGGNLQTFTGTLGGAPPPVVAGGKGFIVNGSQFINLAGAIARSCDEQHNACADAANKGGSGFTVAQCDAQDTTCKAAGSA